MVLGVYADLVYRRDGDVLTADMPFIRFLTAFAPVLTELVVFGRLDPAPGRHPYELPRERVRFVALPHYPRVTNVGSLLRSARRARRAFAAELDRVDAVWLFGPHPIALAFAQVALRRGTPVVLGIRQEYPAYVANRLPSRAWQWAVPVAHALEHGFRLLARRVPAVVVGEELGRRYGGGRAPVLVTGFSLIEADDVVPVDEALRRSWDGDVRILSVGRIDSEKNPLLLPAILAALRPRDPRWRLAVAGEGPLSAALAERADELGVADATELLGNVPYGPALRAQYRASHVFLHVSLTEGVPQVLFEAQAAGLPIVATDVGGVSAALADGERGVLVPPDDAEAAASALERIRADPELRERLVRASLAHAARETVDAQVERVADFFRAHLARAAKPR